MKTLLKLGVAPLAALALAAFVTPAHSAEILYQETFPYTGTQADPSQDNELRNQGWCGGNAGDAFCDNPPGTVANNGGEGAISSGAGSTETPSQDINNDPQGPVVTDAFAFWSQKAINADSFMYTQEFSLRASQLEQVQWDQSDSAETQADALHLAFRIGTDWYISDQSFTYQRPSSGVWSPQTANVSALTFFMVDGGGDPSTLPGGGVQSGGLSLPDAPINAFGVWWDGPKTGNSRIDNFILRGQPAPVPALETWSVLLLALTLVGVAMVRLNRRAG
jgi:hypothetical protein